MFRYLKLLKYVKKINLSPEETLALMHRLETDSCRPEDYEVLMRIVEAHTELSTDVLAYVQGIPNDGCRILNNDKSKRSGLPLRYDRSRVLRMIFR